VAVAAVGDTPELPLKYHQRIVEYCLAQAADLDDNEAKYSNRINQFNNNVQAELGRERSTQYYPFITDIPSQDEQTYSWY
jgi:hypothetical protein